MTDYAYMLELQNRMNKPGDISSNSGGMGSFSSASSSDISAPVLPTYEKPAPYVAPTYTAPVYDESKVDKLTQENAAPAIRGLRSAMQRVAGSSFDNPNVARMTLRDALAGYGQGLQIAMSGAAITARNEYNQEYGIKSDEAKTNYTGKANESLTNYNADVNAKNITYQAGVQTAMAEYQAKIAEYMKGKYPSSYGGKSPSVSTGNPPSKNISVGSPSGLPTGIASEYYKANPADAYTEKQSEYYFPEAYE